MSIRQVLENFQVERSLAHMKGSCLQVPLLRNASGLPQGCCTAEARRGQCRPLDNRCSGTGHHLTACLSRDRFPLEPCLRVWAPAPRRVGLWLPAPHCAGLGGCRAQRCVSVTFPSQASGPPDFDINEQALFQREGVVCLYPAKATRRGSGIRQPWAA